MAHEISTRECPSLEPIGRIRCEILLSRFGMSYLPTSNWIDSARQFGESQDSLDLWIAQIMLEQALLRFEMERFDTGDFPRFRSHAGKCLDRSTVLADCRRLDVLLELGAQRWDHAERKADRWLAMDSQDLWIRGAKGLALLAQGKPALALAWLPLLDDELWGPFPFNAESRWVRTVRAGRAAAEVASGKAPGENPKRVDSCGNQEKLRRRDLMNAMLLWKTLGQPDSAEVCRRVLILEEFHSRCEPPERTFPLGSSLESAPSRRSSDLRLGDGHRRSGQGSRS